MKRRQFLTASIASSAIALAGEAAAQAPAGRAREFYQLRRYCLKNGPQLKLTENFIADALAPAVTRMGMGPVGAFKLDYGVDTPVYYVLIPARPATRKTAALRPQAGPPDASADRRGTAWGDYRAMPCNEHTGVHARRFRLKGTYPYFSAASIRIAFCLLAGVRVR